jgi:hypothetical protein
MRLRCVGSAVIVAMGALLAVPEGGQAQEGWSAYVAGGGFFPEGDYSDLWGPGLQGQAGVEYRLDRRWALGLEGNLARLFSVGPRLLAPATEDRGALQQVAEDLDVQQVLLTARFEGFTEGADLSPYLRAGLGWTRLNTGSFTLRSDGQERLLPPNTERGIGGILGAGLRYRPGDRTSFFTEGRLAFGTDNEVDLFFPVTAGVQLAF